MVTYRDDKEKGITPKAESAVVDPDQWGKQHTLKQGDVLSFK